MDLATLLMVKGNSGGNTGGGGGDNRFIVREVSRTEETGTGKKISTLDKTREEIATAINAGKTPIIEIPNGGGPNERVYLAFNLMAYTRAYDWDEDIAGDIVDRGSDAWLALSGDTLYFGVLTSNDTLEWAAKYN